MRPMQPINYKLNQLSLEKDKVCTYSTRKQKTKHPLQRTVRTQVKHGALAPTISKHGVTVRGAVVAM